MESFNPLAGHEIFSVLKELSALQGRKELTPKYYGIGPSHIYAIERVFRQVNDTQLVLAKLHAGDVDVEVLNEVSTALSGIRNEILAFISNGNPGHLDNARSGAVNYLAPNLKRMVPIGFEVHPRTEAALVSYQAKARRANEELQAELDAKTAKLSEISEALASSEERLEKLSDQIEARQAENEKILTELRESDIARIEKQSIALQNAIANAERALSDFRSRKESELSEDLEDWARRSENALMALEVSQADAAKIVESVGVTLTTGTYADRASTESQKADKFRSVTIALFVTGLVILVSNYLIYAIAFAFGRELVLAETWQALSARLVTGLAVALPAFYTARESARHRTNADAAKQRELELSTLGPFIELLPESQKAAIRERLTDRYFGNKVDAHEFVPPFDAEFLARTMVDAAKKAGGDPQ